MHHSYLEAQCFKYILIYIYFITPCVQFVWPKIKMNYISEKDEVFFHIIQNAAIMFQDLVATCYVLIFLLCYRKMSSLIQFQFSIWHKMERFYYYFSVTVTAWELTSDFVMMARRIKARFIWCKKKTKNSQQCKNQRQKVVTIWE